MTTKHRYIISIDLDSIIETDSEEKALEIANKMIKNRQYSLIIVDNEKVI